jgi:glucose/arabinose dehydrogenase
MNKECRWLARHRYTSPCLLATALLLTALFASCKKDGDDNNGTGNPTLSLVAQNFVSPLGVVASPDGTSRLFVIDQPGKIWVINSDGTTRSTPFIDLSSRIVNLNAAYDERGLLGFAFHPNYVTNGKFYVFYTAPPRPGGPQPGSTWNNLTRIAEYRVSSADANVADMTTERIILEADHPQGNHNGGTIAFGPDNYLYISIGDGGGADDVGPGHVTDWYAANLGGNAQNIHANLMGKVLRIDVNSGSPYSIPSDNPFAGTSAKGEIYAYGFRNPYRFSFDMGGSRGLYLGDAGQKLYEEIDLVTKGGNYGWNVREGNICFNTDSNLLERPTCPTSDSMGNALVSPIITLKNYAYPGGGGEATVVVGGNVYRGSQLPQYTGKYIFGIYSTSPSRTDAKLYVSAASGGAYEEIALKNFSPDLGQYLKGFGQDNLGEIYVTTSSEPGVSGTTGKVYRLSRTN